MTTYAFLQENSKTDQVNTLPLGLCDLGAQYLTQYSKETCPELFEYLESRQVIKSFDARCGVVHGIRSEYAALPYFTAPRGLKSMVIDLLSDCESAGEISYCTQLNSLEACAGGKIRATGTKRPSATAAGVPISHDYDIVVLTMPPKHLLPVLPVPSEPEYMALQEDLRHVIYSSRYALAVLYKLSTAERAELDGSVPWRAR